MNKITTGYWDPMFEIGSETYQRLYNFLHLISIGQFNVNISVGASPDQITQKYLEYLKKTAKDLLSEIDGD